MDDILQYDLSLNSPLFNSKGEIISANKSELIRQLERNIERFDQNPFNENKRPTCIVDVMNTVHKLPLNEVSNFGDFCCLLKTFIENSSR